MKWSWLFSLTLLLASVMSQGIAGAQDAPSTQPDTLILEPDKVFADSGATTRPVLDTPTLSETEIEKSFEDLASADPVVRDAARVTLLGLSRDQLPALREIVRISSPIAPAQAATLRDIVAHVYLAGEAYEGLNSGFMGVMLPPPPAGFQVQLPPPPLPPGAGGDDAADSDNAYAGVIIQDCMPGFCGFRYLRPGDLIIGIQTQNAAAGAAIAPGAPDQFVRTIADMTLIGEVSKHAPGSPLTLRLIRQGRMIDVTLPLSAKPKVLELHELHDVEDWRVGRLKMAQDYWHTFFEPLLGPHVS